MIRVELMMEYYFLLSLIPFCVFLFGAGAAVVRVGLFCSLLYVLVSAELAMMAKILTMLC